MGKRGPKGSHLSLVDATKDADEPESEVCGGRTKSGGDCKKPAGQGTEHPGIGQCRHHDGQVEEGSACPLPLVSDLERRLWDDVVGQLVRLKLYREEFWPHIYGLVIAMAGLHNARAEAFGSAATVKGDNGTVKKHPSSTVVNQMLGQIRQYSNDLGLNPSAMAAMGPGADPNAKPSTMSSLIRGRR